MLSYKNPMKLSHYWVETNISKERSVQEKSKANDMCQDQFYWFEIDRLEIYIVIHRQTV